MKQPAVGIVATAMVMIVALAFISFFSLPMLTGWVSFLLLCSIPMQIVIAVTWGSNPGFVSGLGQPIKGLLLTIATLIVGLIVAAIGHATIGGGINPPTPMLMMCSIVSVVVTFWLAIMWGGWPFTAVIKNPTAAGLTMLGACYVLNFVLFRVFFDYGFMRGAPVYVAGQDPHGLFPAWNALVFYLTCLAAMFMFLNLDLWPLTKAPAVMRQPHLGLVWTIVVGVVGGIVFWIGVGQLGIDPVAFMVRVPVPFIFGSIVVLNMLKNSLFAKLPQPLKGASNIVAAIVIGQVLAAMYAALAPTVTGPLNPGPPPYDFEIWLATSLLSVTFPFLIFCAEFFQFWPLPQEVPLTATAART